VDDRILGSITGTALQLGVVSLICLIAWALVGRRRAGLREWLGLKGAPPGLTLIAAAVGVGGALFLLQTPGLAELAAGPGTVIHAITGGGPADAAVLVALAFAALFKTALAEELLFRGLIARRLYGLMGFWPGNLGQPSCSPPSICPSSCCPRDGVCWAVR
jgi:membrane protease YdiL (CAAX protease family)